MAYIKVIKEYAVQKPALPCCPTIEWSRGNQKQCNFSSWIRAILPWGQSQIIFTMMRRGDYPSGRQRGLQAQLPVCSHPPGRQNHPPSEGKVVTHLEKLISNISQLDSSRTNERRWRRKNFFAVRVQKAPCPTAPQSRGPEGAKKRRSFSSWKCPPLSLGGHTQMIFTMRGTGDYPGGRHSERGLQSQLPVCQHPQEADAFT